MTTCVVIKLSVISKKRNTSICGNINSSAVWAASPQSGKLGNWVEVAPNVRLDKPAIHTKQITLTSLGAVASLSGYLFST